MKIDFLVLACSYKHKGSRCLAGIDLNNRRIIRLVSRDKSVTGAIKKEYCRYGNNNLKPLDIVTVNIAEKAPTMGAQTENYYVDMPFVVKFVAKAGFYDIKPYIQYCDSKKEYPIYPFDNKSASMSDFAYKDRTHSIDLITAYAVKSYQTDPNDPGKWKIKFKVYKKFGGGSVELTDYSCTDSNSDYYKKEFYVGKAILVVSLPPEPYDDGLFYKFVAGIIELNDDKKTEKTSKNPIFW